MKRVSQLFFLLFTTLFISQAGFTTENIIQSDVSELNTMSDPKSVPTATDSMEDWFDSVLLKFGISSFGENNGKFIVSSSQTVSLKPTDPQYGDALVNAFDKAMMALQEKYLMIRFGKTTTEKIRSFYSDRSTNAKEIPLPSMEDPGYIEKVLAILDKDLDVTEKKLDKKLIELGVDPAELARLTPKKKKILFKDTFLKRTVRQASGNISGLFPIQTSVITDSSGKTVIGVVAIASPKTIQVAKDIALQRNSLIKGKGRNIMSLLPTNNDNYMATLGVRLAYDKNGTPAIISYGIASYRPDTSDDYINDELRAEAKADAISTADAQIAEIINGQMNAKTDRRKGEEIKKFVEREMKPGADTIEKTITNIIKIIKREAKSSAHAKLQGISTVKTWKNSTKDGIKFVGAVRVWKYSTLKAVNSFNNPKFQRTAKEKKSFKQSHQESKPVNTIDDF